MKGKVQEKLQTQIPAYADNLIATSAFELKDSHADTYVIPRIYRPAIEVVISV